MREAEDTEEEVPTVRATGSGEMIWGGAILTEIVG